MVLHHTGCTPSSLAGGSLLLGQIVAILLAPWGPSPAPMLLIPQWHSTPPVHLGPPHALLPAHRCVCTTCGQQGMHPPAGPGGTGAILL